MNIIKTFDKAQLLNEYASQNPQIVQRWRKEGPLAWRRILVVRTDCDEAVIFSATLPFRIYAWIRNLIPIFDNYYATKLGAQKVEFLKPSMLPLMARKVSRVANCVQPSPQQPKAPSPAQESDQPDLLANQAQLQAAQRAMERAENLPKEEKLQMLDSMHSKLADERSKYGNHEHHNILKTIRAARQLVEESEWWEAYAVRVQNSRKNPPTDCLAPPQIKDTIYNRLGIIAHPENNDLAPILRTFGTTFISGLLAARELGQEKEFLKYAVSGDDICLEGRAKSVGAWIENNIFTSIPIDVDPHRHDYMQASYGYVAAFKEIQFRRFYREAYKREYEGGQMAGFGEKMIFNSDTWKAYKFLLEANPRFYQHYCTPEKFVAFFRQESPHGVNLLQENGKKYANLKADNVLAALEEAKTITCADHFNMIAAHAELNAAKEMTIKRLNKWTSFNPTERLAIDVARQRGFSIRPRPPKTGAYQLLIREERRHSILQSIFEVLPGGGIRMQTPSSNYKYYPTIEDLFKSLKLQWVEIA